MWIDLTPTAAHMMEFLKPETDAAVGSHAILAILAIWILGRRLSPHAQPA